MTVCELIDLLRNEDPNVEVKVIVSPYVVLASEGTALELVRLKRQSPHEGRRQVHIIAAE